MISGEAEEVALPRTHTHSTHERLTFTQLDVYSNDFLVRRKDVALP